MTARGRSQPLGLQVWGGVCCPPDLRLPIFLTLRKKALLPPGSQLDFPKLSSFALLSLQSSLDSGIYGQVIPTCYVPLWSGLFVSVLGL